MTICNTCRQPRGRCKCDAPYFVYQPDATPTPPEPPIPSGDWSDIFGGGSSGGAGASDSWGGDSGSGDGGGD